jgi:hypothetical protein
MPLLLSSCVLFQFQICSPPTFCLDRATPTQSHAQLNSSAAQLQSASEASAPRASRRQRHLPLKMHLTVIFYYLVTTMCRFEACCLLTRQRQGGLCIPTAKCSLPRGFCSTGDPPLKVNECNCLITATSKLKFDITRDSGIAFRLQHCSSLRVLPVSYHGRVRQSQTQLRAVRSF